MVDDMIFFKQFIVDIDIDIGIETRDGPMEREVERRQILSVREEGVCAHCACVHLRRRIGRTDRFRRMEYTHTMRIHMHISTCSQTHT